MLRMRARFFLTLVQILLQLLYARKEMVGWQGLLCHLHGMHQFQRRLDGIEHIRLHIK